ncbi:MAG: hypothetical protein HND50_10640 [Calditrichaeota bacterium]|nr:hypothetical protein [Calditrichota bacterium]
MKKIASLIVAMIFTFAIAMAVVNTAATNVNQNANNTYASICPIPPPGPPVKKDKGDNN